jgi:uncharacterized membrane protein SpoIIM required for sporulation
LKEVVFTSQNSKKWKELEEMLNTGLSIDPEALSRMYIRLSDDLSFARTYYPHSNITLYLNNLVIRIHHLIYKTKKTDKKQFFSFWKETLPLLNRKCHRFLFYAFLVFMISTGIGWISSANDSGFVRLILGDSYVDMTMENIQKQDPMAVYKQMNQVDMFLGITVNNIKVAFMAYVFGILLSVGSALILFQNGVMMGSFLYLFYAKGLLPPCLTTIFIHGTLEIFAIILAGAAGMMMGNSYLFPKTFSRLVSFKTGVSDSIRVLAGLIPLFIIAGFFEGFLTRHTELSLYLKLFIILSSLALILFYFIFYPLNIFKSHSHAGNH